MDDLAVAGTGFHAEMRILFQHQRFAAGLRQRARNRKADGSGPDYDGITPEFFHGDSVSSFLF